MSDWREKLNKLHKEFEGGYAEDKIVELEYALFEFEKEIYNKAIDDYKQALINNGVNTSVVRRLAEQLKVGGNDGC